MKHSDFEAFGGKAVRAHTLTNENTTVTIIDYGARIQSLTFDGVSVVCGFSSLAGYLADKDYHGAIVGRYANRIKNGKFSLNGKTYTLAKNETARNCHLHGGNIGFSSRLFTVTDCRDNAITLSLSSPDGEEGYPGNLTVNVTYTLENDTLTIEYRAKSDADTVINLTNHAYFNLGGVGKESVLDQTLTLHASAIAEVDDTLIPTGRLLPVQNTPFDFNTPKKIGSDITAKNEQLRVGAGYDHGFLLTEQAPAAILSSEKSGISMAISTTEPAIQVYTANFMTADNPFFSKYPQIKNEAIALECNRLPDSPNRAEFPSALLKAGEEYRQKTSYRFYKNQ